MANEHLEALFGELLNETARQLLTKIKSGEWNSKDIKEARELLKDNHVTVDVKKGDPLDILSKKLPFEEFEDTPIYN